MENVESLYPMDEINKKLKDELDTLIKEEVNKAQANINEIEIKTHLIPHARDFVEKEMLRFGYNEQICQNIYSENQLLAGLVNFATKMIIDCMKKENDEKIKMIIQLKAERDMYKTLYMKEITPINKNIKELKNNYANGEPSPITNYVKKVIKEKMRSETFTEKESTPITSVTFHGVKKEIAAKESEKENLKKTPQPKYKFTIEFSENDDLEFIEKLNKLKEFWVQQQK